jgi:hypothetical protein
MYYYLLDYWSALVQVIQTAPALPAPDVNDGLRLLFDYHLPGASAGQH